VSAFGGIVACNRAWCLVEHVKSNAIVVAKEGVVRGMGARAEESHRFSQGSHHRRERTRHRDGVYGHSALSALGGCISGQRNSTQTPNARSAWKCST
jgi:hypothetical protein